MAHSFLGSELPLLRCKSGDPTEPKKLWVPHHPWQPTLVQRVQGPKSQTLVSQGDTICSSVGDSGLIGEE